MKVLLGAWFTLPRLGTTSFSSLMKQGVEYDRALGFKMGAGTDVGAALRTLRSALGEDVELNLRCVVCGVEACPGCSYSSFCDRSKVSPICLCAEHSSGIDAFEVYQKTFAATMVG
jgi:hypothetical protein